VIFPSALRRWALVTAALASLAVVSDGFAQTQQSPQRPGSRPRGSTSSSLAPAVPATPSAPRSSADVQTAARIAAVVNDEVITQYDIDQGKVAVLQQLRAQGSPPPPGDVLERQLLEKLVVERALMQYARDNGVKVEDAQVERAIQRIADENRLSMPDFRRALEREGIRYERYKDDIRVEMTAARVREREIDQRTVVTDAEVDNFMASLQTAGLDEEYRLAHILVAIPEQARPEQIQARRLRADEALQQLRSGADFAQVAAAYSDAPDALRGGDLGWRAIARLPTVFADTVKEMKVGDTRGVLRSASGFHIVRLVEKRSSSTPTVVQQTRARHILARVNEIVSEADAKAKIDRLRDRIEGGADFGELARLNSEDPSSARGGDLGWINAGDTVPEFEQAMNKLAVNELSQPVRSPFGWHLIQVLDRREQDVTTERARERARQALRERKIDESYAEWLRQLRDRAFVEYRTDER
jgi:peptidyl-prolyl cis-trans isomerase SurA